MKTMSIAQYANECVAAKTPWQRASLFVRSLGLRFKLWRTARAMRGA